MFVDVYYYVVQCWYGQVVVFQQGMVQVLFVEGDVFGVIDLVDYVIGVDEDYGFWCQVLVVVVLLYVVGCIDVVQVDVFVFDGQYFGVIGYQQEQWYFGVVVGESVGGVVELEEVGIYVVV